MSETVGFRRIHKWDLKIGERAELCQFEVHFEKEVDAESGMTLNLVEVDALIHQMGQTLQRSFLEDIAQLVSTSQIFMQKELSARGARLLKVEWTILPSGPIYLWRLRDPRDLLIRSSILGRVELGSGQVRVGTVELLMTAADHEEAHEDLPTHWDVRLADESQILEKLESRFPQALEVFFQDVKTGETWRREL
jgi:hypothetical protein